MPKVGLALPLSQGGGHHADLAAKPLRRKNSRAPNASGAIPKDGACGFAQPLGRVACKQLRNENTVLKRQSPAERTNGLRAGLNRRAHLAPIHLARHGVRRSSVDIWRTCAGSVQ